MVNIASLLIVVGLFGVVLLWMFAIRPYVRRNGKGYRTGANMLVAMWVDWQSCGEIAKERNQAHGRGLYWGYIGLNVVWLLGVGLLLSSESLFE